MTEWTATGAHPEHEALAGYIDGTLGHREEADVETHLAWCDECYAVVTEVTLGYAKKPAQPTAVQLAPTTPFERPGAAPMRSHKLLRFCRRR